MSDQGWDGGADGDRTHDLLNAIQALSQLSYGPNAGRGIYRQPIEGVNANPAAIFPPFPGIRTALAEAGGSRRSGDREQHQT